MFNAVLQQEAFSNESGRTFQRWLIALPLVFVATLAQPYFLGADLTVPVYNNTAQGLPASRWLKVAMRDFCPWRYHSVSPMVLGRPHRLEIPSP
jgi:hypothetical protein